MSNLILIFKFFTIHLTKITATQNEVSLSYHTERGLHFLAVIFTATPTCDQRGSCSGNRVQMLRDQYLEVTQNHLPRTWLHGADFFDAGHMTK